MVTDARRDVTGARGGALRRLASRLLGPFDRRQRAIARAYLREATDANAALAKQLQNTETKLTKLQQKVAAITSEMNALPYMTDPALLRTTDAEGRDAIGYRGGADDDPDRLYLAFETVFRGPEDFIKDRLRVYLRFLSDRGPVVDVGCGRGEMLDLLAEAGIEAIGCEIDGAMVERSRTKGHKVEQGDAVDYLAAQADTSLGAIFSAQVIEHLAYADLVRLLEQAHRTLRPGGVFIAETVNPHSHAARKLFWLDLTHQRPIFPETAATLCRGVGFDEAVIFFPRGTGSVDEDRKMQSDYAVVATTSRGR